MIEHHVSDILGNHKVTRMEGNINQGDKEGKQITSTHKEFVKNKPRTYYGDKGLNGLIH